MTNFLKDFLSTVFGRLDKRYALRHYFFGLIMMGLLLYGPLFKDFQITTILLIGFILLPYTNFLYERILDFIFGEEVYFLRGLVFGFIWGAIKTLLFIWFGLLLAPIGIIIFYFHIKISDKREENEE